MDQHDGAKSCPTRLFGKRKFTYKRKENSPDDEYQGTRMRWHLVKNEKERK